MLQLFRTIIRQREGRVRDKVGEGGTIYNEVFRNGSLSCYTRMTMQNAQTRMDYAVGKFTKYKAADQLGPELQAEPSSRRCGIPLRAPGASRWTTRRRGRGPHRVKGTRGTLELQVLDNLLALVRQFKGETDRAAEFFTQSLLEDPTRSHAGEEPASAPAK